MPISPDEFRKLPTDEERELQKEKEKDKISQFIESLKDPSNILIGCNIFTKAEPRDQTYVLCIGLSLKPDLNSKLYAIESLIREWNKKSFYRFRPKQLNKISPDIQSFLRQEGSRIESLESKTLGHLDLSDIQLVSELYWKLSEYDSIGQTGASKALHMMMPRLFVMWDDNIASAYHRLHGGHKVQEALCYQQFMRTSNEVAAAVLSKTSEEELSTKHPNFKAIGYKKTLAKMLDECNYAEFTLGKHKAKSK
jgi:hypothetical protein